MPPCRSAGTSVAECPRRNSLNTGCLLCSPFWKPKKVYSQLVSPKASSPDLQECLLAVPQYGGEKETGNFLVCPFKNNVFTYFFFENFTQYTLIILILFLQLLPDPLQSPYPHPTSFSFSLLKANENHKNLGVPVVLANSSLACACCGVWLLDPVPSH